MKNIYFVRHGESLANVKGVFSGQKDDLYLTLKGEQQAIDVARKLISDFVEIDFIIYSPLKRTTQTTNIIAERIGLSLSRVQKDERITEYDMGELTGTPIRSIPSLEFVYSHGAEDPFKFYDRVLGFFKELQFYYKNQNVLIVSHAGVGKMLEIIKEGKSPELFNDVPRFENGVIQKIDWIENCLNSQTKR